MKHTVLFFFIVGKMPVVRTTLSPRQCLGFDFDYDCVVGTEIDVYKHSRAYMHIYSLRTISV